jgi:hypothetical protein
LTDITVSVTCLIPPGPSLKGRMANLSAHGLSLILSRELTTGSTVKVEWGSSDFVGEVIYSRPHGNEFLTGVNVADPVYDSGKVSQSQKSVT